MITHLRFCGIPRYERNKNKLMTNTHCSCYIHLQELRHCFSVNLQGRGHAFLLFIETCSLSLSYQFYLVLLCSKAETSSKLDPLVWDPLDSSCLLDLVFHRWRHMGNCRFDWKGTFRLKKNPRVFFSLRKMSSPNSVTHLFYARRCSQSPERWSEVGKR